MAQRLPLIRPLRGQLPPRGKPTVRQVFPWQGKVPRPSGADEVETVPFCPRYKAYVYFGKRKAPARMNRRFGLLEKMFLQKSVHGAKTSPHQSPAGTASPQGEASGAASLPLASDEVEAFPAIQRGVSKDTPRFFHTFVLRRNSAATAAATAARATGTTHPSCWGYSVRCSTSGTGTPRRRSSHRTEKTAATVMHTG